ncbi:MAG: complex I NDUFA9 subunit family protein [Bacteroidota bacterium]
MNVFLTGATGYVGRQVLRDLSKAGHASVLLVRKESEAKLPEEIAGGITIVHGDVLKPESYRDVLQSCNAVINLPGLLREFPKKGITFEGVHFLATKLLIDEAQKRGTPRFIQMSALGVRQGTRAKYQETKFRAEEYLKASGLRWTIFRPSLMFGKEKEGFMNFMGVLQDLLGMMPFVVPVLGDGRYRFQPVAVQNVSEGFVKAMADDGSIGKTYDVAGPDRYTYDELLDMVGYVVGKHKIKIHQPMAVMKLMASALGGFEFFPVSRDQITMLEEGNISDRWKDFFDDFKIAPLRLVENIHKGF